jgi:hypothetical protein
MLLIAGFASNFSSRCAAGILKLHVVDHKIANRF